jgi:Competence protein CoiA-like family
MRMELLDQNHLMNELKIPLASDENARVVHPEVASKDSKYFCPSCEDLLILRKGKIKRAHFSHKASNSCSQETVIHKLAKSLIVQVIKDWKAGKGEAPTVKRKCLECGTYTIQKIPKSVDGAIEERKLDSGYIADVAILKNHETVAVVEVKVHHAVDEEKKTNIGIPFIEVLGEEIIEQPLKWNPITDRFNKFKCKKCEEAIVAYQSRIQTISKETEVPIPETHFRTAYNDCWKCGKEMLIFVWRGDSIHNDKSPNGIEKPKTIQFRYSKMAGTEYWANTCPYCNSIQGDFFLYSEPDSPLFGFSCRGNTDEEFNSDMKSLSIRYFRGRRGTPTR